eukprot:662174_1
MAVVLAAIGTWNVIVTDGAAGYGFYLIIIAAVLICCAISCVLNLFEKINDCVPTEANQQKKVEKQKSIAANDIDCPGNHGLKEYKAEKDDVSCSICATKVRINAVVYGCSECKYDACADCKGSVQKRKQWDDSVCCAKNHPLVKDEKEDKEEEEHADKDTTQEGKEDGNNAYKMHKCNKCEQTYEEQASWYCKQCDYRLCLACFDEEQKSTQTENVTWGGDGLETKPVLRNGLIAWKYFFILAFLVGVDIVVMLINSAHACDVVEDGSASGNVSGFLRDAPSYHMVIIGLRACVYIFGRPRLGCSEAIAKKADKYLMWIEGLYCVIVVFYGFVFYGQMNEENVVDDAPCRGSVLSWTIFRLIEFVIICIYTYYTQQGRQCSCGSSARDLASPNCPGSHGLTAFRTPQSGYACNVCRKTCSANEVMHGCRTCNYDLCNACYAKNTSKKRKDEIVVVCDRQHELKKKNTGYHGGYGTVGYKCNLCRAVHSGRTAWHCDPCRYDLCDQCYAAGIEQTKQLKQTKPTEPTKPSTESDSTAAKARARSVSRAKSIANDVTSVQLLAKICRQEIAHEQQNAIDAETSKEAKVRKFCDRMCSCQSFMVIMAVVLAAIGTWNVIATDG